MKEQRTQAQSILRRKKPTTRKGGVRAMAKAKNGRRTKLRAGHRWKTLSYKHEGKKMTYRRQVPVKARKRVARAKPKARWKKFTYLKHGEPFTYRRRVPVNAAKKARKRLKNGRIKFKTYSYIRSSDKKKITYKRRIHPVAAKKKARRRTIHYAPTVEEVESVVLSQPAYFGRLLARV